MSRPYAMLRAGFPYLKTLGMRRITSFPVDVAIGPDDTFYVLSRAGTISKLPWEDEGDNWDEFLPKMGGRGTEDGKFIWPVAMLLDGDETLFISDEALHRITLLSNDGKFISKWGERGSGDGQLDRPSGIAFDSDGNLLVADTLNHRVQKFTRDGKFLARWGTHGASDGEFDMPWGIAVDAAGDVYVSDWRNDRIQKFSSGGEFLFSFGRSGSGDGELNRPAGVAVDADGDIYVADAGNDRVQLFDPEGRYVEKFIGDATLSNMARVYLMANPLPLRLRQMSNLEPQKRLRDPRSVRVDDRGRMFVPDYGSFRVQVYQKEAIPLTDDQIAPPPRSPILFTN